MRLMHSLNNGSVTGLNIEFISNKNGSCKAQMRHQPDPTGIITIFTNGDSLFLVNMFVTLLRFSIHDSLYSDSYS